MRLYPLSLHRRSSRHNTLRKTPQKPRNNQNPTDSNKPDNSNLPLRTRIPRSILFQTRLPRPNIPILPPNILCPLRPKMSPRIKMPQRIPFNKPLIVLRISLLVRAATARCGVCVFRASGPGPALCPAGGAVAALVVETGRWAAECAAAFAKAGRWAGAGVAFVEVCGVAAVAAGWGWPRLDLQAVIAVVDCAFGGVA